MPGWTSRCASSSPLGHPLASRRSISFKALADQRVALPDHTFQIRSLIDGIALKTKTPLDRAIETNTLEMAKGVVRNSELLTFLPRYAALREIANGELCAVPLQERDLAQTSISLITMPSRQPSPGSAQAAGDIQGRHGPLRRDLPRTRLVRSALDGAPLFAFRQRPSMPELAFFADATS